MEVSDWISLSRINFQAIFNELNWKFFWIGSDWFALARIQIREWFGVLLIDSVWISIRNFRLESKKFSREKNIGQKNVQL